MNSRIASGLVGFLFALGLGLSGMTQPQKIVDFLDIAGNWDPSLLFVMIGAIGVHAFLYRRIRKRPTPLLAADWHLPQKSKITSSLIFGSTLFGLGWGLAGYCPGPALTALASGQRRPFVFVVGMLAGMFLFKKLDEQFRFER